MEQLFAVAHEAHEVIIATGSLTTKSQVAEERLDKLKQLIKSDDDNLEKYHVLVNEENNAAHPLSLRNSPWKLQPWITNKVVK
ncbi:hypothetical protein [Lentilactobacillus kosonis]|uniref:Uncharacterized protein n=1 Tax=Lentilactobacillus kosonis TaxID=2810561 RepID=A0A401FI43_9LACO|nr:hypothetical protein [Lentilactobacillus kosonis]GAY71966.1 hypothetical protein NBRC111893_112 [Lentilactobacillus kosonis]